MTSKGETGERNWNAAELYYRTQFIVPLMGYTEAQMQTPPNVDLAYRSLVTFFDNTIFAHKGLPEAKKLLDHARSLIYDPAFSRLRDSPALVKRRRRQYQDANEVLQRAHHLLMVAVDEAKMLVPTVSIEEITEDDLMRGVE